MTHKSINCWLQSEYYCLHSDSLQTKKLRKDGHAENGQLERSRPSAACSRSHVAPVVDVVRPGSRPVWICLKLSKAPSEDRKLAKTHKALRPSWLCGDACYGVRKTLTPFSPRRKWPLTLPFTVAAASDWPILHGEPSCWVLEQLEPPRSVLFITRSSQWPWVYLSWQWEEMPLCKSSSMCCRCVKMGNICTKQS